MAPYGRAIRPLHPNRSSPLRVPYFPRRWRAHSSQRRLPFRGQKKSTTSTMPPSSTLLEIKAAPTSGGINFREDKKERATSLSRPFQNARALALSQPSQYRRQPVRPMGKLSLITFFSPSPPNPVTGVTMIPSVNFLVSSTPQLPMLAALKTGSNSRR